MTTEPKIKKITEAFSLQPEAYFICERKIDYSNFPDNDKQHKHVWNCLKEIIKVQIDEYEWIYVGINFQDQKIFEIQSKSVNVFYQENKP